MTVDLKMCSANKLIYIIVLIQNELLQFSSKSTDDSACNHPKKKDFGFVTNGSVRESLEALPKIITGFLSAKNSGHEETIRVNLNNCIYNPDCRLHIVLDKKKGDSMTLCVVVKEAESCFLSTCTCPTNRGRREILTHVLPSSNPNLKIQTASCQFEVISSENISDIIPENSTNLMYEKPVESTTNESGTTTRSLKNDVQGKRLPVSGESNWVYGLFIGLSIGVLLGFFATFLWFKRRSSMPKILSVVNGIYNSGKPIDYKLYFHDVTEYSEITEPEHNDEHKAQYQDRTEPVSSAKSHESASFVVHVDTREHIFQKEDIDDREHADDGELVPKPSLVPLNSSDKSDIQQEKESYVKNGHIFEQDNYLIPFNMIKVNLAMCIGFPRDTKDMDNTDKEEGDKIMEIHNVQMENIDSNITYFVLSAIENKKSTVHEFTDGDDNSGENNQSKVTTEHVTLEKSEAGYYKEVLGQESVNMYFELSKSS